MKTNAAKRRVLQTIAGTCPGNALLCRWKLRPTATCDLCACPAETQAHIHVSAPASRARASLPTTHWQAWSLTRSGPSGTLVGGGSFAVKLRELTVDGLHGLPVPQDAMTDWISMCDELT